MQNTKNNKPQKEYNSNNNKTQMTERTKSRRGTYKKEENC